MAIPASAETMAIKHTVPGSESQLHPDITMTKEDSKQVVMVDVTIPFENQQQAFTKAPIWMQEKYQPLADTLKNQGYDMKVEVLIIGALRAWDLGNESIPHFRHYAKLMWCLMMSDTIQ
ncbi:hypothetical protein Y1Q_0019368 [Alligator mississippiensis]|uniref:Uncharacterized protein n=1 Tax=Alligator mississippiensis TaxID=8496 RepID=A0A151MQY2_ALLMI|nr:hypothetical protein Y1Q_0019368 [Alligator mississippiensis]